jgi:hypothetical protein
MSKERRTKSLVLLAVLAVLSGCSDGFTLWPLHYAKAEELCELNGGVVVVTDAQRFFDDGVVRPATALSVKCTCKNGATFAHYWSLK